MDLCEQNLWDLLPQEVANSSYAAIHKALTSRSVQTCEYKLPTPIGLRDYEARVVVSGHEEILAIVRDITERKQAEAQLHMSVSRNRLLAETLGRIRRSLHLNEILQTTVTSNSTLLHFVVENPLIAAILHSMPSRFF